MHKEFTDEELTAYLDGEYDYTRADDINKALAHDNDLKTRLEALSFGKGSLKMAFDDFLEFSPELSEDVVAEANSAEKTAATKGPWQPSFAAVAAIAFICFSLGLATQFLVPKTQGLGGWKAYVAAYQALYINSTLSSINNSTEEMEQELQRASLALGKELPLNALSSLEQLDYKRAQILGFKGRPVIQLTFLSATDQPIALCIVRANAKQKADAMGEIDIEELEGMSAASWNKNGYNFLLIGGNDTHMINEAANRFYAYL